jgi:hypothetical protein
MRRFIVALRRLAVVARQDVWLGLRGRLSLRADRPLDLGGDACWVRGIAHPYPDEYPVELPEAGDDHGSAGGDKSDHRDLARLP